MLIKFSSLTAVLISLSGCLSADPEYVYCKGNGTWTINAGAMLYSANAAITTRCEDGGVIFYKGPKPPEVIPVPPSTPVVPTGQK